ncbi:MAG: ParB/RepB/Spo0J family partition protein [Opitutaceae bacterium]|jgi:ParB/RepB/Spo0J family partition protein
MKTQDTEIKKIAGAGIVPVQLVKVADIVPDPKNRKNHDAEELARLADSIRVDGLLQPITVRLNEDPLAEKYMIVAGERRWHAHRLLKRGEIEARVVEAVGLSSVRKRGAENIHREDLNPIEQAELFAELETDGMTQDEIAKWAGKKSQSYVSNSKRLLALPGGVKAMLKGGELERAYGVVLCKWVSWPAICEFIAIKAAADDDMSAKRLDDDELPYDYELKKTGLVVEIDTSTYGKDVYVITPAMRDDPDYLIPSNWRAWCLNPQKWAKEKAVQDAARAVKKSEATQATKSAKKAGDAKPTAEQLARKRKLEGNKAARALIAQGLKQALDNLRAASGISSPGLRVVLAKASSFGYGFTFSNAATALGIKLPKGGKAGMEQLGDAVMVKLVAAAIMIGQAEDATRHASKLPGSIELVAGKIKIPEPEKPKAVPPVKKSIVGVYRKAKADAAKAGAKPVAKKKAGRVQITPDLKQQVVSAVQTGKSGAEIAKTFGISLPSVQNIKKEAGLVKANAEARRAKEDAK